jgi:hypothetical protein
MNRAAGIQSTLVVVLGGPRHVHPYEHWPDHPRKSDRGGAGGRTFHPAEPTPQAESVRDIPHDEPILPTQKRLNASS